MTSDSFVIGTVGVVSDVSVSDVSAKSFLVEWTSADAGGSNFEITGYRVEILLDGMVVQNVDILVKDQTSRVIGNLQPETTYEIRVFARNRHGEGRPSSVVSVTMKTEEKGNVPTSCSMYRTGFHVSNTDENIGPIVGGVVGVIAVVTTGVIIVCVYYKMNRGTVTLQSNFNIVI